MAKGDSVLGSGSTITQQVIKHAFIGSKRSVMLKLKEMLYATMLERRYSKDEILSMYLSAVRFNGNSVGLLSGAKSYFALEPAALSLTQALFLAFALRNPCDAQVNLLRHEHTAIYADFMRIKLFEVFFFYVAAFGPEALYNFERYSYLEVKQGFCRYSGRKTYKRFALDIYREVEWLAADYLHEFMLWFCRYLPPDEKGLSPNIIKRWRADSPGTQVVPAA